MRTQINLFIGSQIATADVEYSVVVSNEEFASDLGTGYYREEEIIIDKVYELYYISDDGDVIQLSPDNYTDLIRQEIEQL